jgi:hypothetical protein
MTQKSRKIEIKGKEIGVTRDGKAYFNATEFRNIRNESGSNSFTLSRNHSINSTHAIDIVSKAERYGGTYAHPHKTGNSRDYANATSK